MALTSATGGSVYIGASSPTIVPNGSWNGNWRTILANVTQSDCGGATKYFPTNHDPSWTISLCRDDTAYPEAVGLTTGTVIAAIFFRLGSATKADKIVNTTVESVDPVVDTATGEVVRVTITGKGGLVTFNQNLPS